LPAVERPSALLLRLEIETHAYHREADRPWLEPMTSAVTKASYGEQLARAYAFESPLEAALAYTPCAPSLVGMRSRSRLLARDLFALDLTPGRVSSRLIAPFPSVAEALGWVYVVERQTRLLARVKHNIERRLPGAPTAYVSDEEAPLRWSELGSTLDRIARTPRIVDQVLHAAHDGFRSLLDWYVSDQALRPSA
jgi:heme oxygenase